MGMTWDELVRVLDVTPDGEGFLDITRRFATGTRRFRVQRVTIGDWDLALVQTVIAREEALGTAEAATRLTPFPLGSLAFADGFWALRQALGLEALTPARFELALRCLAYVAREIVPAPPATTATQLFAHYSD